MYRPNRIGPSPYQSIDIAPYEITLALLGLSENDVPTMTPIIKDSTVREETNHAVFWMTKRNPTTATNLKQFTFGIIISGEKLAGEDPQFLTVNGQLSLTQSAAQPIAPQMIVGRLDGAPPVDPVTTAAILTNYTPIPALSCSDGESKAVISSVNQTILYGNAEGSVPDLPTTAIFVGWNIIHIHGSSTQVSLQASVSVHKYKSDINTVDPTRG